MIPTKRMYRINRDNKDGGGIADLMEAVYSSALRPGDGQHASVRSMHTIIRQVTRSPDALRIMTQLEFEYDGVVDGTEKDIPSNVDLLKTEWYDSTFAIADHSNIENWIKKACVETGKGKVVVMLLPARTNRKWFHTYVLEKADEVRFIQGALSGKNDSKNSGADCLAVYKGGVRPTTRSSTSVAIIGMKTSFTENKNEII